MLSARNKGRHEASGWVGDAIYGINDGLGSIFGIVSGVAGATLGNAHFVLIAGLAGMIASALSMGSGAYLAAKSEREIYEAAFARERDSVEHNEPEAREILSLTIRSEDSRPKTQTASSNILPPTALSSSRLWAGNGSTQVKKDCVIL